MLDQLLIDTNSKPNGYERYKYNKNMAYFKHLNIWEPLLVSECSFVDSQLCANIKQAPINFAALKFLSLR